MGIAPSNYKNLYIAGVKLKTKNDEEKLNKLFERIDNLLGSEYILDHPISIDVIKEWFNEYEIIKTKYNDKTKTPSIRTKAIL